MLHKCVVARSFQLSNFCIVNKKPGSRKRNRVGGKKLVMKKITIEGKSTGTTNNFVKVHIYRPSSHSNPYDHRKSYHGECNFKEILNDLIPQTEYYIFFSGYTTGKFVLKISGDFECIDPMVTIPIVRTIENGKFSPSYIIRTN